MMPTKVTPKEMHQERIHQSQATQDQRMSVIAMETWSLAEEFLKYKYNYRELQIILQTLEWQTFFVMTALQ